jgi:hypothetical protein
MINLYNHEYLGRLDSFRVNAPDGLLLDTNKRYHDLKLEFHGTLTRGMIPAGVTHADYPLGLINTLKLIANGSEELKMARASMFYHKNCILHNCVRLRDATAPAVGAEALQCVLPLDIAFPLGHDPVDTMFPTQGLTSLKLEVIYGALADLIIGHEVDLALTNCYFDVWGVLKNHKEIITSLFREKRSDSKELVINSSFEHILDQLAYSRIWFRGYKTDHDSGVLVPVNLRDMVRTVRVKAGEYVSDEIPLDILWDDNFMDFGTEGQESVNLANSPIFCLNFTKLGMLGDVLDCRTVSLPKLFFDVYALLADDPYIEFIYEYIEEPKYLLEQKNPITEPVVQRVSEMKGISADSVRVSAMPAFDKTYQVDLEPSILK